MLFSNVEDRLVIGITSCNGWLCVDTDWFCRELLTKHFVNGLHKLGLCWNVGCGGNYSGDLVSRS